MTDELSAVPATQVEIKSALTELVVRAVRDAGELGLRKDEIVAMARERGLINDGVDPKRAMLWVRFACSEAAKWFAQEGEVMICDPKGGALHGFRHRLTERPDEAHEQRTRKCKDIYNRCENLEQVVSAEAGRFDEEGAYEEFFLDVFKVFKSGLNFLAGKPFSKEAPTAAPSRRKKKKAQVVAEAQESLL